MPPPASSQPDTLPDVECHSDHSVETLDTIQDMEMETLVTTLGMEMETLATTQDMEMETLDSTPAMEMETLDSIQGMEMLFWTMETLDLILEQIVETLDSTLELKRETLETRMATLDSIQDMEMETATQGCQEEDPATMSVETSKRWVLCYNSIIIFGILATDVEVTAMGMVMEDADLSAGQDVASSHPVHQLSNGMLATMETVSHVDQVQEDGVTTLAMDHIIPASTFHPRY